MTVVLILLLSVRGTGIGKILNFEESQQMTKFIMNHPSGTMNVSRNCNG